MSDLTERVALALAERDGCAEEFRGAEDYRFSYMIEAQALLEHSGIAPRSPS